MIAGRNGSTTGSDLTHAASHGNTGLVPAFRPEDPSIERERVEL